MATKEYLIFKKDDIDQSLFKALKITDIKTITPIDGTEFFVSHVIFDNFYPDGISHLKKFSKDEIGQKIEDIKNGVEVLYKV